MPANVLRTLILSKKEIPRAFLTDTMSQSGDKLVGEITIMKSVSENGRTDFWTEGGGEEPLQPPNPEVWMWKDTVIPKVPDRRQRQNVHQQEQPRPTVQLEQPQPTIKQEHPRPAVQLEQPQPTIKQEHPRPAVQLEQRPTVQVDGPRLSVQSPHTLLDAMHKTLLELYERNLNEALVELNAAPDTNGPQYTEAKRKIANVTSSIHDLSSRVGRDKTLLEFYERNLNEALVELNAATDTNGPQYTEAMRKITNVTSSILDLSSRLGREHGI